jgi:hypothetical protein
MSGSNRRPTVSPRTSPQGRSKDADLGPGRCNAADEWQMWVPLLPAWTASVRPTTGRNRAPVSRQAQPQFRQASRESGRPAVRCRPAR